MRLAVASNFKPAMDELAETFQNNTNIAVSVTYGSSGKLYAQILHGAPFHIYLSADMDRPQKLAKQLRSPHQPFVYALGKLVVVYVHEQADTTASSGHPSNLASDTSQLSGHPPIFNVIANSDGFISIANPVIAPYGEAAQQTLSKVGLWKDLEKRLVRGENVQQAFQFVQTGHAKFGLVSKSTLFFLDTHSDFSVIELPLSYYKEINQGALQVTKTPQSDAFVEFLKSKVSVSIIESKGYGVVSS